MIKVEETKFNWKNINSYFVLKNIFCFLNTKQKLSLIIYNKELKEALEIGIKDYKKCGRYKNCTKKWERK